MEILKKELLNPENSYRQRPVWYWNDAVTPEELRRGVAQMRKVGMAGCIIAYENSEKLHYSVDELADFLSVCADEAAKSDMEISIYHRVAPLCENLLTEAAKKVKNHTFGICVAVDKRDRRLQADFVENLRNDFGRVYIMNTACDTDDAVDFPTEFYEYADVPVVRSTFDAKAARCSVDKRIMTACFDDCGWNTSLEEYKNICETLFAAGADLLSPVCAYSLRGDNKNIYQSSFMPHQPWWDEVEKFNLYISRLSKLLCGGRDCADVLLINPFDSLKNDSASKNDFSELTQTLSSLHLDYHIADEAFVLQHAVVENGKLRLKNASYSTVILFRPSEISTEAAKMLCDFYDGGGKIYSVYDDIPDSIENRVLPTGREREDLLIALTHEKLLNVKITDSDGNAGNILYRCRDYGKFKAYFFLNTEKMPCNTKICINGEKSAVKLKLEDLSEIRLAALDYPAGTAFTLNFAPMQSHVVIVAAEGTLPEGAKTNKPATAIKLKSEWQIEECDANAAVYEGAVCDDGMKYEFEIDENMSFSSCENLRLAAENARDFEIYVNGKRVFYNGFSWWKDSSFEVIDIKDFVLKGKNEILFKINSSTVAAPDNIYIIGNFGVYSRRAFIRTYNKNVITDGPFVIADRPKTLPEGKTVNAGLPFFGGRILLSQNLKIKKAYGERIYLDFAMPCAALCRVYINSTLAYDVPWADFPLDITDFVKRGANKLSLELIISNRNLFGPHHRTLDGANEFNGYRFVDAGI